MHPYLSVVVTTRNDDHGVNPLGRFQAFVNCLAAQCRRVSLPCELIVVEWNPPPDRPPLREVLKWPNDPLCDIRIVQVPPQLHRTLKHADALPLFQMIAKNVGIRRARGEFVLSTNIDILLSTPLMDAIASRSLQPGTIYRVDRHDVEADVPADAPLEELMAYCRTHQIRKNARSGSFPLGPNGEPALWPDDIVDYDSGIQLGDGWHMREGFAGEAIRWVGERAEVAIEPLSTARLLNLELEPNPFVPESTVDVSVTEGSAAEPLLNTTVANVLHARTIVQVPIAGGSAPRRLTFHARSQSAGRETLPAFESREQLIYRVHRIWWDDAKPRWSYPPEGWRASADGNARVESTQTAVSVITAPANLLYAIEYGQMVSSATGDIHFWITLADVDGGVAIQALNRDRSGFLPIKTRVFNRGASSYEYEIVVDVRADEPFWLVVSNARGDGRGPSRFTIVDMRGSRRPEDVMNIASLAPTQLARWRASVRAWTGRDAGDPRHQTIAKQKSVEAAAAGSAETPPLATRSTAASSEAALESFGTFLVSFRPDSLHLNACGDFQLMSRADWWNLRGFAEFEMYSMNIDGLFGHTAHYGGIREHVFEPPACVYHIEHEAGSGWTPEGENKLRKRIEQRGIGWLDSTMVTMLASFMKSVGRPMIFNGPDWGFAQHQLPETVLTKDTVVR